MELTPRDRQVIAIIERTREKHHACTAASVAAQLKMSKAYMSEVMHDMIVRGLLVFSPEMPGSLRISDDTAAELFPTEATEVAADRHVCTECDWPTSNALNAHMRSHKS